MQQQSFAWFARRCAAFCAAGLMVLGPASIASAQDPLPPSEPPGVPSDPGQLPSEPPVDLAEAEAYANEFDVSTAEAVRRLEAQVKGLALDAALRDRIGAAYGGLYFDNGSGGLIVSGTTDAALAEARDAAEERSLGAGAYEIRRVNASLSALEAAQSEAEQTLSDDIARALVSTGIDVMANAVVIQVSSDAPDSTQARVDSAAQKPNVATKSVPPRKLEVTPDVCTYPNCNKPLRGGVRMYREQHPLAGYCTAGFVGYTAYEWVMFTAGHCVDQDDWVWWGYNSYNGNWLRIGRRVAWDYGNPSDSGLVRTTGSLCDWCPDVTTPIITAWYVSEAYPINYRWFPYPGLWMCHVGATTPLACGYVEETNITVTYTDGTTLYGMFRSTACGAGGDSGGPWVANYIAIGLLSGISGNCSSENPKTFGVGILNAEARLGARVHTFY